MDTGTHSVFTFFGYEIIIPSDSNIKQFISDLYTLNSILDERFKIKGVLNKIPRNIDYISDLEIRELYNEANIIIGFVVVDDISKVAEKAKELEEYIVDNPILDGLVISDTLGFYSGLDLTESIDSDSDSDSDSDDDNDYNEDSDDETDEDTALDEDSDDGYTTDSTEYKVHPQN